MHTLSLPLRARCLLRPPVSVRHSSTKPPLQIPRSALSLHWDTLPPTVPQLAHASSFFLRHPPSFLHSSPKFATMPFSSSPEICLLGRSNVGKSSLLNALLGQKIAHTSAHPGRTRLMNAFSIGGLDIPADRRLVLLDMPGYGKGGRAEWGIQILRYLEKRKEMKRAFLLVDAQHGVKDSDRQLLQMFAQLKIPFQVVLSKADRILWPKGKDIGWDKMDINIGILKERMEEAKEIVGMDEEDEGVVVGEVIATSADKWMGREKMGVDALRFAMLKAAGLELKAEKKLAGPVEMVSHEELAGLERRTVG